MKKILGVVSGGVALLLAVLVGSNLSNSNLPVIGSVQNGNDYTATTTGASMAVPQEVLVTGNGALGSVVITGALGGEINFYNATTTNANKRTDQVATSTIWLASIPANTAAGTYTFDVNFYDGLLMELPSLETTPTTTVSYKQY